MGKVLKGKKGFTLIELLAVIVVLAIVMVLAATTVLPYMSNARKDAFALEANTARKAAANAVSLINAGAVKTNYTKTANGYCFTIADLKALGLFEKDYSEGEKANDVSDDEYVGVVEVTQSANAFTYLVKMKNSDFYVSQTTAGDIKAANLKDVVTGTNAAPTATEVPTACTAS